MEKRYQVFVSSTFRDLTAERRAVIEALLEMDAIPAGMELFPATDDDAWTLIQRVIEQSDYYVLIVGGRYGSTNLEGLSYTEREYDFAIKSNVPVLAFLHERPDEIPAGKSELDLKARESLAAFRKKVEERHHCKYWKDPEQLGSRLSRAMLQAVKVHQRIGWVRADEAGGPETLAELNRLRLKLDHLNEELRKNRDEPPKGSEQLLQGGDQVPVKVIIKAYAENELKEKKAGRFVPSSEFSMPLGMTWDEVYSAVAPLMLQEAAEGKLKIAIEGRARTLFDERNTWYQKHLGHSVSLNNDDFQAIKVQLIALGLMQKSDRRRGVSDTDTYWTLTPYGENYVMKLRALRRDTSVKQDSKN
ncbi:MAG: DUF4062 domain-containing protein [Planctomycetes bacterium]|nr:DUF4062 domain-containing protein [Planctomycetota bacterium]